MFSHRCRCTGCDLGLAPVGPRHGPHHVGVRFGTHEPRRAWVFKLDGEPVTGVIEALAGPAGHIYRFTADPGKDTAHLCRTCKGGVCATWDFGNVEIECDGVAIRPQVGEATRAG